MAYADSDPSCQSALQTPQPFVWTEDAHCLYLSFLEDAFVNDLYHGHFCFHDICGFSPPFSNCNNAPPSIAAGSPPSAPSQGCAVVLLPPEPNSSTEIKLRRKRPHSGCKMSSTKSQRKWLSDDEGLDNQLAWESSIGPQDNIPLLEQPGSSSQTFECCERVVPKGPRGGLKRSRSNQLDVELRHVPRTGADQV
eukprot:c17041_g1_i1 orf=225-806(+)